MFKQEQDTRVSAVLGSSNVTVTAMRAEGGSTCVSEAASKADFPAERGRFVSLLPLHLHRLLRVASGEAADVLRRKRVVCDGAQSKISNPKILIQLQETTAAG